MMKRRTALKLLAAPALMTIARRGFAKEKVTYAYLLDPAYDAVTWAMSNGKVTSDLIDVEARGLAIPQLIQATSAKQYDVIMTAAIALPPAAARGLELKVLSTALQQSAAGEGARYLGQKQFADQGPAGAQGQVARLLRSAFHRLYASPSGAHSQIRAECGARGWRHQSGRDPGAKPARSAGSRPDRCCDADPQPGLSRPEVRRISRDRGDRTRQH